jgi:S1-C subfamily serine protease
MTVVSAGDLSNAIDAHKPGDQVKLRVRTGGKTQTITVKLGQRPASVG